jgi:hypothetical protein
MTILQQKPVLGNRFIQSLQAKSQHEQYKKNNKVLQSLYIKAIGSVLDKICAPVVDVEGGEAGRGMGHTMLSLDNNLQTLYHIISLFDPHSYQNYSEIREIFGRFLELSGGEIPKLNRESIVSGLIGGHDDYLVQEFLKLEHEIYVKSSVFPSNLRDDDITEEMKVMLKLSKERDIKERMHQLFLLCHNNKEHFLHIVVVITY